MKNEQNAKKRKPWLRIGITMLASASVAVAGYFIAGSVTMFRDLIVLALGADAVSIGIETSVALVNKIKNKDSTSSKSKSRSRTNKLERSQEMDRVPVEEQTVNMNVSNINTATKENTKKQGR